MASNWIDVALVDVQLFVDVVAKYLKYFTYLGLTGCATWRGMHFYAVTVGRLAG